VTRFFNLARSRSSKIYNSPSPIFYRDYKNDFISKNKKIRFLLNKYKHDILSELGALNSRYFKKKKLKLQSSRDRPTHGDSSPTSSLSFILVGEDSTPKTVLLLPAFIQKSDGDRARNRTANRWIITDFPTARGRSRTIQ
jgi:hypothetical protein